MEEKIYTKQLDILRDIENKKLKASDTIKCICPKCKEEFILKIKTFKSNKLFFCRTCKIKNAKSKVTKEEQTIINNKRKATCLQKYGNENFLNLESTKEKLKNVNWNSRNEKSKLTKKEKYGDENYNNREKAKESMIEKYGDIASKTEDIKIKQKDTCIKKYGGPSPMCDKSIVKKAKKTKKEKYGNENYNNLKKYKETCLEVYGYDNPMKNKEILEKSLSSREFQNYGRIGYDYDNGHFDSSWELAYYIWLKDNNKKFIYHPSFDVKYIDDEGHSRNYFPDFLVEGQFIEIKGNQFFNKKGEPYNLYKKEFWWNKYNFLLDNNVKIIRESEIYEYLNYVKDKYGNTFLKDHKRK